MKIVSVMTKNDEKREAQDVLSDEVWNWIVNDYAENILHVWDDELVKLERDVHENLTRHHLDCEIACLISYLKRRCAW
jgi:hypothetical protein